MAPLIGGGDMDRDYTLPDGRRLHRWVDENGRYWLCLMSESVCIGCDSDGDGMLDAMLQNVLDNRMTIGWDDDRGFVFSMTDEGKRAVEHMLDDPPSGEDS